MYHSGHVAYYMRETVPGTWVLQAVQRNTELDGVSEEDVEEGMLNDDQSQTIHARHVIIDTGWKIDLDRGLDTFLKYEMHDAASLANRLQAYRLCNTFEIAYNKENS